jgi:predicted PurR-regulated permease PerM
MGLAMPLFSPLQRALVTWLLLFAAGWTLLQVLEFFREFITVFITAGLLAFVLSYPVLYLQKYLPRLIAIVLVYVAAAVAIAVFAVGVAPVISQQTSQLVSSLPDLVRSGTEQLVSLQRWMRGLGLPINATALSEELGNRLQEQLRVLTSPQSLEFLVGTFTGIFNFVLILVIAFYMLLDGSRLWQDLIGFLPQRIRRRFSESLATNLRSFFTGQLLLGLFMAALLTPIYLGLGVPFALVLGLFVGLMELLPFIGASLGIGVVVLISLVQNPWLALWVLVLSVLVQQVKDNVLAPRILGNLTGLNPVLIFGALLIGARIAGLLGVLLAIPTTGVIKALYETLTSPEAIPEPPSLPEPADP